MDNLILEYFNFFSIRIIDSQNSLDIQVSKHHISNLKLFIGRQFGYDRALEIVQDEQYLEDVDFDQIRRYDILKKIGEFNPNFNIPESRQKIQWQQGRFMGS